jgi:two-component system sensor histidine kinase HydH
VLRRFLSARLLALAIVPSVLLVGTCISGALYLNRLHGEVSRALTENVESTRADLDLETTLLEMVRQLRGGHGKPDELTEELIRLDDQARTQLDATGRLANTERERDLVGVIRQGMDAYRDGLNDRASQPAGRLRTYDRELARRLEEGVLPACTNLLAYNTILVEESDQANRLIVNRLTSGLLLVGIGAPLCGWLLGYAVARRLYQSIYRLSVRIRDAAGRLSELHPVTLEDSRDPPELHGQMRGIIEEMERVIRRLQQREREVLRAEQLAAVGQVAAGVAHELRNPLTSVKMLVQTGLEGDSPIGLPPEDLAIIEHEVRRMEACIQTFLDFARPPSAERRCTDLLPVVRRALALIEGRARRQKVEVKANLPPGPVELFIDPEQVQQVLLNLLLNALDAMPRGGTVHVAVEPPSVETSAATVRVSDTGRGIAPDIQVRLFEPFVSSKETGLGLGLSICRRLVEGHGGTIHGSNAPEGGAVFTFTLPSLPESVVRSP